MEDISKQVSRLASPGNILRDGKVSTGADPLVPPEKVGGFGLSKMPLKLAYSRLRVDGTDPKVSIWTLQPWRSMSSDSTRQEGSLVVLDARSPTPPAMVKGTTSCSV